MDCINCKWTKYLKDSYGRIIYICVNADSPYYLEVTDNFGGCHTGEEYNGDE